jgi:uncharacterized protein YijF (DUF1287 family)
VNIVLYPTQKELDVFLPDEMSVQQRLEEQHQIDLQEQEAMEQAYLEYARGVELYRELIRTEIDHERILMLKSLLMGYQEDNK